MNPNRSLTLEMNIELSQLKINKYQNKYFQDKISRENGRNKNTEDEINDLKKQVALLSRQVRFKWKKL